MGNRNFEGQDHNTVINADGYLTLQGYKLYKSHKINGKYKKIYHNHSEYDGNFVKGKREGAGELEYYNGATYKGNFKDDKEDGDGILVFEN